MKKLLYTSLIAVALSASACSVTDIQRTMDGVIAAGGAGTLTQGEVASGLKQALEVGINNGAGQASQTNGYFGNPLIKIPFPEDVQRVENTLRQVGLGDQVDKFVLTLNRGAEDAAKSAIPIFVSAIKQMTIQDAWAILRGDRDAATQYLKRTTSDQLYTAFNPIMVKSLEKTNATRYYTDIVNQYNKIPLTQKVNPDLDDYATQKAIDGLFVLVAQEEEKIRENPLARTTDLLRRVFAQQ
ncbi:DUF4197 domain-containing protein [Pontibacter akesuensis]|uniref:DUF4197 domain-containing protein n=1 Tax=Pontibacter akesuensis TaxID=388950 RepID=A0A1I7H6F5_9BACT|nr:DUF4197 domain-containing protein [Pontibacter akesuensis]GHA53105.1 hypothetical protein GCM10007389_00290 [Pontibacter akesuensis]SFU56268.1 Protein of unknown function [Pontibacter akesuensis]